MKTILSASLFLSVWFPLSVSANTYVCTEFGTGAAGYPKQMELTTEDNEFYINGNALFSVNYMGAPLLKLKGSDLLYSVHQEKAGQRALFLFDPLNSNNRSQPGMLRAVNKYVCNK